MGGRSMCWDGDRTEGLEDGRTEGPEEAERTHMIRALYTAASGMNAQQMNMDNVANNLANVNTAGFKKSRVEFEDLVYQEMRAAGTQASTSTEAPTGLEIGLGTRPVATARNFTAGNLKSTGAPLD